MSHEDKDELPPFHGLTVAIGLYISYKAYKVLMDDIKLLRKEYRFEERKKDLFSILSEQKALDLIKNYKIKRKMYRKYDIDLNKIKEEIQNIHNEYFPLLSKIIEKLDILSLISNYDKTFIMKVIRLSNMVRNRFTILDLFEEMNILKNFSELFFQL
jgi:glycerol-1-phosphate dehydrogenase [NAD(P)+]